MDSLKVYLSGATRNVNGDFQYWRNRCHTLHKNGYFTNLEFVDPINFFNYTNKIPKTEKQCLDLFMWQIERCDVVLINLDYSIISVGSMAEVEHAFCNNIPVIGFGEKKNTWYNWCEERCSVVFDDLDTAIEYLSNSYAKTI